MKRRTVIAGAAGGVLALGLVGLAALPWLLEGRLAAAIDAAAEALVDVEVEVGAVDVQVYPTFPRILVTLDEVHVRNKAPFEGVELAAVPQARVGIDLFSAISGSTLVIESVEVDDAAVHVVYDEAGRASWDVLPEAEDGEAAYHLRLEHVAVQDLDVVWEDRASGLRTKLVDVDATAGADLDQTMARVDTDGTVASLTLSQGGVTWLQATRWKTRMQVDYNQETGAIEFGENEVLVNALPLSFSGSAAPTDPDDWTVDVDFSATDTDFAALLSVVPDAYDEHFDQLDASGQVSFTGNVEGLYDSDSEDFPSFGVELRVEDARFKHPDAPGSIDALEAQLLVNHPGGELDAVRVRAEHFRVSTMGSTVRGRLRLAHPMTDPDLDLMMDGAVDLGALRRALPVDVDAPPVDGRLDLDFAVRGRMSDFENQRVERVKADGTVHGRGLEVSWEGEPVAIERLDLALSPRRFRLNDLSVEGWGSDFTLSGTVDDALPWLLTDDGVLGGELELAAGTLDARPFQGSEEGEAASDDAVLVAVPERVDLRLALTADRMVSDELTLEDARGRVSVKEQVASLDRLAGRTFGGRVVLSGTYSAPTAESADLDLRVESTRLDVVDAVSRIETLALIAPVLEAARGRFDADLSVQTTLAADGTPDLSLISSAGSVLPIGMTLQSATLDTVARKLSPDLDRLVLTGARIAYAFQKGTVELEPFTAKLGPQKATISGDFGPLDKHLDLLLDLPVKTKALQGSPLLASLGATLPKIADVEVRIRGTYAKPKVGVGLKGRQEAELVEAALDPLVQKAMDEGDRLIAEAEKAADALVAQARKAANTALDEARDQARKLRRDAKGKPLQELAADKGADLLLSKAEDAKKAALKEARVRADDLVAKARREKDRLVSEARDKAASKLTGGR